MARTQVNSTYHPDFGDVPVHYEFRTLPESPDGQVRSTISDILKFMRTDARSPVIQEEARKMVALSSGDPNLGLWTMLKPAVKFKYDEDIASDLPVDDPRKEDTIEVLIRPLDQWLLIKMRGLGIGDCDCFHMYGGCLLLACGVPCSLVTISGSPDKPYEFSHVYLASYFNGVRTPIDMTHGPYLGWEAPNQGRIKEWRCDVTKADQLIEGGVVIGALAGIFFGVKWFDKRRRAA